MLISENYKIESDDLNLVLYKKTIVQEHTGKGKKPLPENIGQERWGVIGYFSPTSNGFRSALRKLCDMGLLGTGFGEYELVVKKIDELYALIKSVKCPANLLHDAADKL